MPWVEISKETYHVLKEVYEKELNTITHAVTICEPIPVITREDRGEDSFGNMRNLLCYTYDWLDGEHIYERWIDFVTDELVYIKVRKSDKTIKIRPFSTDVKIGGKR